MPRQTKSQWEFGELFPTEQTRQVLSVSDLTGQIRSLLEGKFGQVWVSGEITNLRAQSSGHIYFTIKDATAQMSCVLFRGEYKVDRSLLQDGRKVTLKGEVTVYEPRGQYQLRVTEVEAQGVGALQAAFEKLKAKLKAEGLFETERKRPLPRFPKRIGLVTSQTGAAIQDVLHVVGRRNPSLELVLAPCRVQGDGAASEIAAAVKMLNDYNAGCARERKLDLILVTRGGGSLEDLWAFNEEAVARAIAASTLPVVSAVGHEIDFTICDFVADLRAATPSAAAEIITEGVFASYQFITEAKSRLSQLARQRLNDKLNEVEQMAQRLGRMHPRRRINDLVQHLDELSVSLARCARKGVREQKLRLRNLSDRLNRLRPRNLLRQQREVLHQARERLEEQMHHRLREKKTVLVSLSARLRLLGPEQVLARGYSITTCAESGQVLRDAAEALAGTTLQTRLHRGKVLSTVIKQ